ncbi:MAG: 2-oxoacid:acceptor oxidoreductase family protein [Deltaproteobacteria bacterium]|jgi:2-oxoglutarate ferredoxin oxidoreductase subunit gamma|nr:2-oxoacid:acceptor oxidoreductase family protein [Deltaproteobacteria bacterium]
MERCRLVFSGSGGQGIITAAVILSEAAVIYENLNAVQSQAYGPAARGGATRSDIIISESDINFPKVIQPNVLICLTQEAYNTFCNIIRPGGLLITDARFVKTEKKVDAQQKELSMYVAVMEKIGKPIVFNICMLGAVISLTDLVEPESIMKVLESRIPSDFLEMNRKALELGIEIGSEFKG